MLANHATHDSGGDTLIFDNISFEKIIQTAPLINLSTVGSYFPSRPAKKSLPNSPLLSLKRRFLLIFSIFFMSSELNLKSPSKLDLIREGVLDFGSTE